MVEQKAVTLQVAGTLLFVAGLALAEWAVVSNRFYSGVVRIQRDRGHVVVSTGPYRHIRHPGYVGGLLAMVGLPLLLGSWTMLIAATLPMGVSVLRTTREDRTLREELEGYEEYTGRVRYRLIPGLW